MPKRNYLPNFVEAKLLSKMRKKRKMNVGRTVPSIKSMKAATAVFDAISFLQEGGFPSNVKSIKKCIEFKNTPKQCEKYIPLIQPFLKRGLNSGLLKQYKGNYRFVRTNSKKRRPKKVPRRVRTPKAVKPDYEDSESDSSESVPSSLLRASESAIIDEAELQELNDSIELLSPVRNISNHRMQPKRKRKRKQQPELEMQETDDNHTSPRLSINTESITKLASDESEADEEEVISVENSDDEILHQIRKRRRDFSAGEEPSFSMIECKSLQSGTKWKES